MLRDANDEPVIDEEWHEALLDVRTAGKRERVAAKVGAWGDDCSAKGFQAVEPDNYDSYTRSHGLLSDGDAQAFVRLLSSGRRTRPNSPGGAGKTGSTSPSPKNAASRRTATNTRRPSVTTSS